MDQARFTQISRFLSKYLRHAPDALGLELRPGGFVGIDDLLAACDEHDFPLDREELIAVVQGGEKQRFEFDAREEAVRARYGHSVPVDLGTPSAVPPDTLFHGTARQHVRAILARGILPMRRRKVHLSEQPEAARAVGARHGEPFVLKIDAAAMVQEGHAFHSGGSGIWLVDQVPPRFCRKHG